MKRGTQHASAPPLLLLVALVATIIHSSQSQEQGGPAAADHWVWGQRSTPAQIPHAVGAVGAAAIVPSPYGRGRSLGNAASSQRRLGRVLDGDVRDRSEFKSITARSFPTVSQPRFNALGVTQEAKQFIKPSSVQKKQLDNSAQPEKISEQTFQSTEFGGRLGHNSGVPSSQPPLITTGEFPYPFGSSPIDLGDGTSIGWVPQDTLFVRNNPSSGSNAHSANQFNLPNIADDQDARYTTLDKLFDARTPTKLPDPHSLPNDVLGGLHPDEVYYADKDLVIIKGGGFTSSPYEKPSDLDEIEKETDKNRNKPSLHGNELGEANDIRLVNVRPDEQFSKVSLPFRFVNGNIPTIVQPGAARQAQFSRQQQKPAPSSAAQHRFRPVHQTSFRPTAPQGRRSHSFTPLASQQLRSYSSAPNRGNYQNLDEEEIMEAEPSFVSVQRILPPVKRSADSSVLSYHHQSRGTGENAHSIVDYKLYHENAAGSASNTQLVHAAARGQNSQQNAIPLPHKGNPEFPVNQHGSSASQQSDQTFDHLEDLSIPEGSNPSKPRFQTPKQRPGVPRPPQRPQTPATESHFVPAQPQPTRQSPPRNPTATIPFEYQFPISLEGDTRVNFLPPLPPVHRQAEFLGVRRQPQGSPVNQGGNPHRGNRGPAIVRGVRLDNRQQGRQAPHRAGVTRRGASNRFMEPRRRVPLRPRQGPPRV